MDSVLKNDVSSHGRRIKKELPVYFRSPGFIKAIKWCPLPITLLILALLIPTEFSFNLGGIRFNPYRIVLLVFFFPAVMRIGRRDTPNLNLIDIIMLINSLWSIMALGSVHNMSIGIESGGIRAVESLGPYLMARAYIVNARTFWGAFSLVTLSIIMLAPFTLVETITGKHFLKNIAAAVTGNSPPEPLGQRMGLTRAYGTFDHPILYGVFAASVFAIAWYGVVRKNASAKPKMPVQAMIVLAAVTSVSSGAVASLSSQLGLCMWDRMTKKIKRRWLILAGGAVAFYVIVGAISNRSAMSALLSYFTFSAHNAQIRILIFDYGIEEVWRHPVFGIGFNDWVRPSWMYSASVDNFWLVQAMMFGIPAFITLVAVVFLLMKKNWKNTKGDILNLRMGWTIALIGLSITACTVHFWNASYVYFCFFLGTGVWFTTYKERKKETPKTVTRK